MTDKSHATLTGTDLHEPKGVAAASSNTVYIADGAGSGAWSTVPNPLANKLLHVRDSVASGVASQTMTNNIFNARRLQTIVTNEITGAGLSSDQITLPAGTYWMQANTQLTFAVSGTLIAAGLLSKLQLYDVTLGAAAVVGHSSGHSYQIASTSTVATQLDLPVSVAGRFTCSGTHLLQLLHWYTISGTGAIGTLQGGSASTGAVGSPVEVYTDVMIWKL